MSDVVTQSKKIATLRSIRDAAKRAVDRGRTGDGGNPWQIFADELDETIIAAERDNGSSSEEE